MLGRSSYPAAQIAAARREFARLAAGWRVVSAQSEPRAVAQAEVQMFNQMVVALDAWFMHRLRGAEGKDGNPMNEVRLLAAGVTTHGGVFPSDPTIKWKPESSVSGYRPGDAIALTEEVFSRLADVFLHGITAKFSE